VYNIGGLKSGKRLADQLRNHYCIDHLMRKRKWWWSIWWWGIQVLLVNAYVLHKTAHIHVWKLGGKSVMSQYEFPYCIMMAWFGMLPKNDLSRKRPIDVISTSATSQDTPHHP
jgi:hypothetical protein